MFSKNFLQQIDDDLIRLQNSGLYKNEYQISGQQSAEIKIWHNNDKKKVLNFCANNYLGLANNHSLINVAKKSLEEYGLGAASVRFICGTLDIHKKFENKLANFLGYEDCITFSSCFAANGALFSALFTEQDAIISADLNHASIIDGIRLCKAKRYFYQYNNMQQLEQRLQEAKDHQNKIIVTDGVFSMDGDIANLPEICNLAEKYNAILVVDDSHATGFIGKNGRGTAELCEVEGRIDILVSTLGKALGGAGGGFIASKKNIINKLRNYSRPYLFSNNILPLVASVGLEIINMIEDSKYLIEKLASNAQYFRQKIISAGFDIYSKESSHPVVPIMLYDAILASKFAKTMIEDYGIYVIAFSYPVVPKDTARIRVQISASHEKEHLDTAINAFIEVGKKLKVIK